MLLVINLMKKKFQQIRI
ncbi:hypothetical protein Godav_029235 [Gossypium davidsonii]|uniref:Uncharacterized protein n=1 Tax=Gossypium davidsonii TaxID=34287 RepID=A0A7J8TGS6_GOSDV|nr:hypothetical protein [Gossypium davidsonii]